MVAIRQVQNDGEGGSDQVEQSGGRERPGHGSAKYRARFPNRGIDPQGASGFGLVPFDRFDPRPGQGKKKGGEKKGGGRKYFSSSLRRR